ncbi:unnamed protein product [Psylliodes chrysocephalus]|uniref:O-acyltransferase n=1 Tax=Psylliodes chrysocephalus TaxID=3402493 RepID=A0A9P0CLD4_9CUCU|nr:unnamed protein product [Psylliodes chrysocephala]
MLRKNLIDSLQYKNEEDNSKYKEHGKPKQKSDLPTKQFQKRRSLLVELIEDNVHVNGVYNIIISLSFFIMISLNYIEYIQFGRLSPALDLIYEKFGKLHIVFIVWLGNNLFTFLCYYCFILWAAIRQKVDHKNITDKLGVILLASYYGFTFYIIPFLINKYNLPFASSAILLGDSIRFLIKVHAFVRGNAPKVLTSRSEKEKIKLPTFGQFVDFVYIPATIYKDEYPRTDNVRWSFAFYRFMEIIWTIVCQAHIYIHIILPIYKDLTCINPITFGELFILLLKTCIPAVVLLWLLFFSLLHSSQNTVGEMLKFGDRMFYLDWWNSLDVQQFYKKWNCVIGDWLYTYVNKDLAEVVFPGRRNLAKLLTILISAIIHEWIITAALGFYCPVIFVIMIATILFLTDIFRAKSYTKNIRVFIWMIYPIGPGLIATSMFVEYFARQRLPMKANESFVFWNHCIA